MLKAMLRGELPFPPSRTSIYAHIGRGGKAGFQGHTAVQTLQTRLARPRRLVRDMLDSALGCAVHERAARGQSYTNVESL